MDQREEGGGGGRREGGEGGGGGGETDKRRLWSMKDSRKLETLTAAKMMDRRYRLLTAGAGAGPRVGDRLIPALAG